jgi:rhodanese-related sulfurtransferase
MNGRCGICVNEIPIQSTEPESRPEVKKVLCEAVLVAFIGAALAFAANAISPRGLALTRNYSTGKTGGTVSPPSNPAAPGATNQPSADELLSARLKEKGLQLGGSNQVARLFHDPGYQQGIIVFVDARDDEHYQQGHIPGAYQLFPYHPENYLATVLPVCQAAEQVVVYCTGGECEDSELAAVMLRDAGIPGRKLLVYGGGITEWTSNQPVEIGARMSGNLRNLGKPANAGKEGVKQ